MLVMPDEHESELYFWYNGNPFGLSGEDSAIVSLEGQVLETEPVSQGSKETVTSMAQVSESLGYLVAGSDCLVVNVPTKDWSRLAHELLQFFPEGHSAVHRVSDDAKEIAATEDIGKRLRRVQTAEGPFAAERAPTIDAFRLPPQKVEVPPRISSTPIYEAPEEAAA